MHLALADWFPCLQALCASTWKQSSQLTNVLNMWTIWCPSRNFRVIFECIRKTGLEMTNEKCQFAVRQTEFIGRIISPEGFAPDILKKTETILNNMGFLESKKHGSTISVFRSIREDENLGWLKSSTIF